MGAAGEGRAGAGCSFLILAAAVAGIAWYGSGAPVPSESDPSPIVILPTPVQVDLPRAQQVPFPVPMDVEDAQLTIAPMAEYRIAAQVVGRKRYRGGWQGQVVPYDLGLAWGDLPDPDIAEHVKFWQGNRWLFYSWDAELPVVPGYIMANASNHHVIPATDNVRRAISRLSEGDIIEAEGYLVTIGGERNGQRVGWASSMSREDTGDGACELMYIESLKVDGEIYR